MKNNQRGITLVALIITIIVMLILAAVVLIIATNDNGVIKQAQSANERQSYAATKEKIQTSTEFIAKGTDAGKADLQKTKENIEALKNNGTIDYENCTIKTVNGETALVVEIPDQEDIIIYGVGEEEKVYSFTLNQLDAAGAKEWEDEGVLGYDATKFWEVVGKDLSGQYGIAVDSNGQPTGVIGPISTDSNSLRGIGDLDFSKYSDGDFAVAFLELNGIPVINIIYFYDDGGTLAFTEKYFENTQNGGYAEVLNRWGDVNIYFGINE